MKEQLLKLQEVFTKAKGISIELGLIDDIGKELKDAAAKPFDKAMKLLGQAITLVEKAESNTKAVGKKIDKAEKAAKDLGVDIPELKEYKELYKANIRVLSQTISDILKART